MIDPTGLLLTGIRDWPAVAALTTRVRAGEPAPGDAIGPPYQRFIVLTALGRSRLKRAPIGENRYLAKCYGLNAQTATELAGAVADAIHAKGRRVSATGVVILGSFDDGGGATTVDPDTKQPYADVVIRVNVSTALIPPIS